MADNGLETFEFHADDDRPALNALRAERSTSPSFAMEPAISLASLDPETAARQHLNLALGSASMPGLTAGSIKGVACEFSSLGTESIPFTDTKTVKFRQTYNKIPVYGSLVTVELDDQNELMAIRSGMGLPYDVDPIATVSPSDALMTAQSLAGSDSQPSIVPRLVFYFDPEKKQWRLVYLLEDVRKFDRDDESAEDLPRRKGAGGSFSFNSRALLMDYMIDAHTGELVAEIPRTPSMASTEIDVDDGLGVSRKVQCERDAQGNMSLRDVRFNVSTHNFGFQDVDTGALPGVQAVNPPPPWDGGAISAHANAVAVAQFLREVLQRNGIDNLGGAMISSINCIVANESPDGREWRNAAWIGTQMIYGQRRTSGNQLRSYAVGMDVVGHEIFHGVTDRTARLEYRAESGALNESYSDIFGVIISNLGNQDIKSWNWEMGEELNGTGIPLRDLGDPTRFDQPDNMDDFQNLPVTRNGDWGGVHVNSGIHNKAAFNIMTAIAADGSPLFEMGAIAVLFYLALTQFLSRTSGFDESRRAILLVARTLFRNDADKDAKLAAIVAGFDAVGITG